MGLNKSTFIQPRAGRLELLLRALHYRNFRLFFIGQLISLIGSWMQNVALSWLVYSLTNSAFMLGIVAFMNQAPAIFLTPIAGVFADRHNRHRLLLITQSLAMLEAAILTILVMTKQIQIWQILALSCFAGIVFAFDIPVRHAFVYDMIEKKEDLGNAIALNASVFNAARLVGPSLAGIIIAVAGEGICFLINGFRKS